MNNKYHNKNYIFAISGPSASGKGSVWAPLKNNPDNFYISVSHTTRPARKGEIGGVDYHFIDETTFDAIIQSDDFLEWEQVHEHRYGTKKSDFLKMLEGNKKVVIEIDVNGAETLKRMFSRVITIFITPSDISEAKRRLKARNTENAESMRIRQKRYAMELERAKNYDYLIINDNLQQAQKELLRIVDSYN